MQLYLIRHAEAVPLGEQGITQDEDRPLTEAGILQAKNLGTSLQKRGIRFDRVLTSPLVRARQTAEQMVPAWSPALTIEECQQLSPGCKRRRLMKVLRNTVWQNIALVGHQPDLGTLAAWLIGGKRADVAMAKAGVALIDCSSDPGRGCGSLQWLLTPDWMAE